MDKNTTDTRLERFYGEEFWDCAHNISSSKARKLIGHYGFTEHDVPDIKQELLLELIKRLQHFTPEKARITTFIMRVAESRIADLISFRQANCRDWKKQNIPVEKSGKKVPDLVETIPSENEINFYLTLDINEFIDKLPAELAEICELLKHYTITEILEEYPISRTAFHHKLKKLKKIFHQNFQTGKFP
jgi:RNA polymerase sigma factor (sigma-70 family)